MKEDEVEDPNAKLLNSAVINSAPFINVESSPVEEKPFTHFPNQYRNDTGPEPGLCGKCWLPIKVFLLILLFPFLLVGKLVWAIYEVFYYSYLMLVNQGKILEKGMAFIYRNRTKKELRKPLSMVKESVGIDLTLNNVEKRMFRRMQPTPEYLAVENLILKLARRGRSTEEIVSQCDLMKERENVGLRQREIKSIRVFLCKARFTPETMCNVRRSEYRIESYWMIWPGVSDNAPVVLYFHGGGFIVGNTLLDSYISYLSKLSHLSCCKILSVNYRLCPEYTIHDAVSDCEGAFDWLVANQGVKPSRIALAGESAGGGLCLMLMQRLKSKSKPQPSCAHLISPFTTWVTEEQLNKLYGQYSGVCLLTQASTVTITDKLVTGVIGPSMEYIENKHVDLENPELNPLKGDFEGLPPLQFLCSDWEFLHDNIILCANKAKEAGVQVELIVKKGLIHAWPQICKNCLETDMAITLAAEYIKKLVFEKSEAC